MNSDFLFIPSHAAGIGITTTFIRLRTSTDPGTVRIINVLIPIGLLLSAIVTLMTSSLIAYRIYTSSQLRLGGLSPIVRFRYVIRILFESAAVYSGVAIANAAVCAVVSLMGQGRGVDAVLDAGDYLESLTYIVAVSHITRSYCASGINEVYSTMDFPWAGNGTYNLGREGHDRERRRA